MNVVVELFRTVAEAFPKVIIMLLYVPASALVFARSSFMVCRLERFTSPDSTEAMSNFGFQCCPAR